MKRFLIAFLSLSLLPLFLSAYVSPGKPSGYVNDFAGMLQPLTVSTLNQTLADFAKTNGSEISVVTILTRGSDETIETYAEKLFQEWGIGNAKNDNGLLLIISRDDREMRIEVGYGLEPIVTDIESASIIRDVITPAFKDNNYDRGVSLAVIRIMDDISKGEPFAKTAPNQLPNVGQIIYPAFLALIFLSSILARSKSWWLGGLIGGIVGIVFFSWMVTGILVLIGLLFDYIVSKTYKKSKDNGMQPPWWIGGGGMGSGRGGGFGGFGGGSSGGGGASGKW